MPTATATHHASNTILAIADSSAYATVEGNIYFPPLSLLVEPAALDAPNTHLHESGTHTTCPWKGKSSYYDLILEDGSKVRDLGWFYPEPKTKAEHIKDFVAWYGNKVEVKIEA